MSESKNHLLRKFSNIPKRLKDIVKIIRLVKNWREYLSAKFGKKELKSIRLRNGVTLTAPPQTDLDFLFQEIWLDRTYSPRGYQIAKNDVIIDIGANIGVFALYAATAAADTQIHAFEPFPENIKFLRNNIGQSGVKNIDLEEKAVAQKAETRYLEITASGITHKLTEKEKNSGTLVVESTSLDNVLDSVEKCDLLKIDCEGSEYEIFYYCSSQNLRKIKKIVGEYHDRDNDKRNGRSLKKFLEDNSFRVDYFVPFNEDVGLICATSTK